MPYFSFGELEEQRLKKLKECEISEARGLFEFIDIWPRSKRLPEHYEFAKKVGYKIPRCFLDKDDWDEGGICRFCHIHQCKKPE